MTTDHVLNDPMFETYDEKLLDYAYSISSMNNSPPDISDIIYNYGILESQTYVNDCNISNNNQETQTIVEHQDNGTQMNIELELEDKETQLNVEHQDNGTQMSINCEDKGTQTECISLYINAGTDDNQRWTACADELAVFRHIRKHEYYMKKTKNIADELRQSAILFNNRTLRMMEFTEKKIKQIQKIEAIMSKL